MLRYPRKSRNQFPAKPQKVRERKRCIQSTDISAFACDCSSTPSNPLGDKQSLFRYLMQAFCLESGALGRWPVIMSSSTAPSAPPPPLPPSPPPENNCHIAKGAGLSGRTNRRLEDIEAMAVRCAGNAANLGYRRNTDWAHAPDIFQVTTSGSQVCVQRTDRNAEWEMNLKIACEAV